MNIKIITAPILPLMFGTSYSKESMYTYKSSKNFKWFQQ